MTEHYQFLVKLALGYVRNKEQAEDLVQETYLRAHRFQHRFDGRQPKAWLATILIRVFYTRYRKNKREIEYVQNVGLHPGDERESKEVQVIPEESAFKDQLSDEVITALNSLSHDHRSVIVLSDLNGLSYKEIAETLSIPVGTVMSRLHRARANFREFLREAKRIGDSPAVVA